MKQLLSILFAAAINISAYAQAPNIQWQKSLGGSASDEAHSIQQTKDGGYIIAGQSYSDDGQVTGHHGTSSSIDYWVVKLNDTGAVQWEKSFGGSADDLGYSIQQTYDGGYILAGAAESDDGDLSTCDTFEYSYWLLKLDDTGGIEWKNCFGSQAIPGFNKAYFVQQTPDSNYIVAGNTISADSGEVTGYHGGGDYWVIKVSSTGGFLWGKCLGGSSSDVAYCVQYTSDGGYIVCGQSGSNDGQVTGHNGSVGVPDYWVVKLDDMGGMQWQKSLGGSGTDIPNSIRQTFDGGYIVAGKSNSTDSEVTGNHGGYDFWVVKLDDTGAVQWEKSLGGAGDDIAYSIQQTADSGYIIGGSSDSSSGEVTGTHGSDDYWIVKLSKAGNLQWQKSLGGSGIDDANAIQQTTDSGYIVAGGSNSTDGNVTGNHGAYDYWVVKLSSCLLASPTIVTSGLVLSTSIPYASYKWELNGAAIPGATNATYTIASNGSYTVFVADTNACTAAATVPVIEVGVKTIFNNSVITVMPNPTTGMISITGAGMVNIGVYNIVGQLIKDAKNTASISIAEFPAGLYFLRLSDEQGQVIYDGKITKL